ncbi:DNA-directed RNA polymerase subunit omega [Bifidobacterium animalis subsp. animalis MCC 1489]|uniref:DNA-directed RNA polymerase subunit omega n=3 Tax=Bifidobacterium animalis TaxID=28025 RepID=A0AB34T5Q4_9BIFI|nr:DNA-directed RNA polymerase subunit omega [Bifidobacterium animalis subsp. animalis MCC 0483]KOA53735.1 DNA-directed RNA polymerase subunit omega [Bifidobacterium animalis subsp. animalis ATCC 27672]KOA60597.1 DNA-directed RNA polymerase subunit omega [Bifidobacterium animalis subsp. animalis MCC 0499]KOA64787.1 DNA-directed RNA polymerase subunit omega [Bifidobacterium animalis subsp. animalis MCC 1489]CDI67600.1 DNA-directed RNA polymerase subunit omega (RNAP o mega subunit) (RNA polymeras
MPIFADLKYTEPLHKHLLVIWRFQMAFGTEPTPTGLADPPIDDLMEHADSKYALAIFAAKRARQINSYFTQLNEGLLQNVGPLVEYKSQEKPLSIAFREIDEGLLEETLGEDDLSEGN